MNIKQILGNRVLIEPLAEESITRGGLELPQSSVRKQPIGIVLMVGTGNGNPKLAAQMAEMVVGQAVKTNMNMGSVEVDFGGRKCRIHSIMDIEAILG